MNRKGFTLVELLAVIIILALLALLTATSITKLVSDSKQELSATQEKLIESAAKTWGAENIMELPSANNCVYITLEDLQNYGLMDSKVIDPKTNKEISAKDLKIKISSTEGKHGNTVTTYEVNPDSVNGCTWVYGEKTKCAATTVATAGSYTAGDLYTCDVSATESYDFYVLSDNLDGTVTLLMSENLGTETISWNDSASYLTNQTSSWTITDDIAMPTVTQVGCPEFDEGEYCYGTLPSYVTVNGANYWTTTKTYIARYVYWYVKDSMVYYAPTPDGEYCCTEENGCWENDGVCHTDGVVYGVRPIITVDKDQLIQ